MYTYLRRKSRESFVTVSTQTQTRRITQRKKKHNLNIIEKKRGFIRFCGLLERIQEKKMTISNRTSTMTEQFPVTPSPVKTIYSSMSPSPSPMTDSLERDTLKMKRDSKMMSLEDRLAELDRLVELEKGIGDDEAIDQLLNFSHRENKSPKGKYNPGLLSENNENTGKEEYNINRMSKGNSAESNGIGEFDISWSTERDSGIVGRGNYLESSSSALNSSLSKSFTTPQGFNFQLDKRNPEDRKRGNFQQITQAKMSECTFQPQINPLPQSYSRNKVSRGTNLSFYERSVQWKEQLRREADEKAYEKKLEEERACTFKPSVNPLATNSSLFSSMLNAIDGDENTHRAGQMNGFHSNLPEDPENSGIHERLYASAQARMVRKEEERQQILEDRLQQECTFEPRLVAKRTSPVQSRYMRPEYLKKYNRRTEDDVRNVRDEKCTFQPRINSSSKRLSGSSKLYLQENAFERLSRPKSRPQSASTSRQRELFYLEDLENSLLDTLDNDLFGDGKEDVGHNKEISGTHRDRRLSRNSSSTSLGYSDRPSSVMDNRQRQSTDMRPKSVGHAHGRRPQSALSHRRSGQRNSQHETGRNSVEGELSPSFQKFLDRQQSREQRKQERMSFIKDSTAPPHNPRINRKSEKIVKRKNGNFFDRLKVEVERRTKKQDAFASPQGESRMLYNEEKECTFEPKINRISKKLPGRSVHQMSAGELERRKRKAEMKKKMLESRELEGFEFKPRLNRKPGAKSFLRVQTDPESYMNRIRHMSERQEERIKTAMMEREQRELEKCTFQPKIHEAPEFVKRIARSMANLREVESQMNESSMTGAQQRPDWR